MLVIETAVTGLFYSSIGEVSFGEYSLTGLFSLGVAWQLLDLLLRVWASLVTLFAVHKYMKNEEVEYEEVISLSISRLLPAYLVSIIV